MGCHILPTRLLSELCAEWEPFYTAESAKDAWYSTVTAICTATAMELILTVILMANITALATTHYFPFPLCR